MSVGGTFCFNAERLLLLSPLGRGVVDWIELGMRLPRRRSCYSPHTVARHDPCRWFGLRYFDFQVENQVTWQPGPLLSDGRHMIFLSMEGDGMDLGDRLTNIITTLRRTFGFMILRMIS